VYAVQLAKKNSLEFFEDVYEEEIGKNVKGKTIRVKTLGQSQYISAIKKNDLVFGIGPAGTGKTYLAVVMAVNALKNGHVQRIILTRPAVEAGESLGFLPGDLKEKVDPYLRPLYDALHDVLGTEHTQRLIERGVIEIAPLAYMRGRTLDDAFVILDEAQNTTMAQMKMFLTRLGFGSKMVITGDISQIDLPKGAQSGLAAVSKILTNVKGISFVHLEQSDVVRHPLVGRIIQAYEQADQKTLS
jgi:phosphate starvation-inducible PhoH-like protein